MVFASVKIEGQGNSEANIGNGGRKMSDKIYYVNFYPFLDIRSYLYA